jgi:serine/threonine-protein kinase
MVSIRHAGLEGATVYLVQDYVVGDALDVWMRDAGGALPAHRALGVLRAIARALDAAAEFSVGHGALHPRDVFIGASESDVRITGFGIAQALEEAGLKTPIRRPYAAPERVEGRDWDRRADIYSLAAIAQDLCPDARDAWAPVLVRALSEDPAARFATATELANALSGDAVGTADAVIVTAAEADAALASLPEEPVAPIAAPAAPRMADTVAGEATMTPAEPARSYFPQATALGDVDLPLPAKAPIDLGLTDVDVEIEAPPPASYPPVPPVERPFPWLAVAAVGLAMFAAGGTLFYGIGVDRGRQERIADSIARVTPKADPVPEPPQTPEVTPEPTSTPRPTPAAPAAQRAAAPERERARTGTVTVDSRPRGATVTIDGRRIGETPRAVELSPGVHAVLIQLTGHRPVRSTVDVVAGRQTRFAVTLEQFNGIPSRSVRKDR